MSDCPRGEAALPNPVSPPGTPTTGSALLQTAQEMRARADFVLNVCEPYATLYPAETAGQLARDVVALLDEVVSLSADVTRLEREVLTAKLEKYATHLAMVDFRAQAEAAEVRVKELEQQVSALTGAPGGASWADRHVGRSWVGHPLEDDCPCPKQPCGLVKMSEADPGCDQHGANSAKTIRQAHDDWCCPARPSQSEGALPASSVVPVEAGTGTGSGQEQAAPDGEAPA